MNIEICATGFDCIYDGRHTIQIGRREQPYVCAVGLRSGGIEIEKNRGRLRGIARPMNVHTSDFAG
jgi:hypothetical protein